jgi:hypothetical protein
MILKGCDMKNPLDEADIASLRRIVNQLTPEGMDFIQLTVKQDIMNTLQGAMNQEEAFKLKLELDACDNFFHRVKTLCESAQSEEL